MADNLSTATWFWLMVPMLLVVVLALISWLRHRLREGER